MQLTDVSNLLDPELRAVYDGLPAMVDAVEDPERARAMRNERFARLGASSAAGTPGVEVAERRIPVGARELLLRVHRPVGERSGDPAIVWLHGGGFTGGSVRYEDGTCGALARDVGAVVVAVEYRLLPEATYPAQIHDTCAAISWIVEKHESLGVDPRRIAVAGLSAGATIAASVALYARDSGDVQLAYQLLLYGSTDDRLDWPSAEQYADPRSPTRAQAARQWRAYLGDVADTPPAYAAPARAVDLSGLPPAYIMTGGVEISRDENIAYARRLIEAGVPTELHVYPGAFHGFDVVAPDARVARDARDDYARALRRALCEPDEPTGRPA